MLERTCLYDRDSQTVGLWSTSSASLGTSLKCKFAAPSDIYRMRSSGYGSSNLCFNTHSRWFWCRIRYENCCFRIKQNLDKKHTTGNQDDSTLSLIFERCFKIEWAGPKGNEFTMLQEHRLLTTGHSWGEILSK